MHLLKKRYIYAGKISRDLQKASEVKLKCVVLFREGVGWGGVGKNSKGDGM